MIWCCPILLCLLQHCIWVPWEAFGHILKEWMSLASSCGGKRLRFGCLGQIWHSLALFQRRLLLQYDMVLPNSSLPVATLYLGPMGSLWAYIEGMDVPCLLLRGQTAPIWLPGPDLALSGPLPKTFAPPV